MCKIYFFEGPDYSGKTTFINNLEKRLIEEHKTVCKLKEPSLPYRPLLITSGGARTYHSNRFLYVASHVEVMDYIYRHKDEYDYFLVDRASIVSDKVFSSLNAEFDNSFNTKIDEMIEKLDVDKYDRFFKNNSSLILINIPYWLFIERIERRQIDTNDFYDTQDLEFKKKIFFNYDDFIKSLRCKKSMYDKMNRFFNEYCILDPMDILHIKEGDFIFENFFNTFQ